MKLTGIILFVLFSISLASCNSPVVNSEKKPGEENAKSNTTELDQLEKLIQQYPDSILARTQFVNALEKVGELDKAIEQQKKLAHKDSLNALHQYKLAHLQLRIGDTIDGIKSLKKSIWLDPDYSEAKLELGFVYADQKSSKSLRIADDVLHTASNPSYQTQARYLIAIYYSNINDKSRALKQLEECIINDYTFLDAHLEKGIILYDLKRFEEAMQAFQKVLVISNTNAEAYYWTGRCYEAMNKKVEAIDAYKKTLGIDDNFEDARAALSRLGQ